MANKVQFNCQLPKTLAEKVRADARRNHRSLDDVSAAIFGDFFKAWCVTERAKFYAGFKAKTVGRKVGDSGEAQP
jgi:nitrogenase molybdenum-iron protein alpha/beta subunit